MARRPGGRPLPHPSTGRGRQPQKTRRQRWEGGQRETRPRAPHRPLRGASTRPGRARRRPPAVAEGRALELGEGVPMRSHNAAGWAWPSRGAQRTASMCASAVAAATSAGLTSAAAAWPWGGDIGGVLGTRRAHGIAGPTARVARQCPHPPVTNDTTQGRCHLLQLCLEAHVPDERSIWAGGLQGVAGQRIACGTGH